MQSTLTSRETDPHDMFVIEPDVVLAARADAADPKRREPDLRALVSEISAGVSAQAAAPKVDTSFRAAHIEKKRGRWVGRFIVAFLFALVSAVGAAAWQRYGERAQATIAMVPPGLGLSSLQTSAPTGAIAGPDATPEQSTPTGTAATSLTDATAASAPSSPDQTQVIQSLTRDVAAMGQQIDQLKASIAELKAGREQLVHDAKAAEAKASEARAFEQSMRAKVSALPPRPPAAPVRKPKPPAPPAQTAAAPLLPPPGASGSAPVQIAPPPPPPPAVSSQEDVPRPPMPVR
jgi:cytoskeletal protein RodZ